LPPTCDEKHSTQSIEPPSANSAIAKKSRILCAQHSTDLAPAVRLAIEQFVGFDFFARFRRAEADRFDAPLRFGGSASTLVSARFKNAAQGPMATATTTRQRAQDNENPSPREQGSPASQQRWTKPSSRSRQPHSVAPLAAYACGVRPLRFPALKAFQ
jgi:hypothetical protein